MKAVAAADLFHGKEKYNCAQAVLKAFQKEAVISEDTINKARFMGGGKAQAGICGALYASLIILNDFHQYRKVSSIFEKVTGSCLCRDIKKNKGFECKACVFLSSMILDILLAENSL